MKGKRGLYIGFAVLALLAVVAVGLAFYARTRPRLAQLAVTERLKQVDHLDLPEKDARGAVAALREFLLDYPDAGQAKLRLKLAKATAEQQEADFLFVADQVEQVATETLSTLKQGEKPTQKLFTDAGFTFEKDYRAWTDTFFVQDIDGDGSPDVIMNYPNNTTGVCCLFRHTPQGWQRYRLMTGVEVLGIWIFDITPHGPKAIEIATLADSEYAPNLFVDVFAWQNGRMNSVLSTRILHGFQLDHKDVDGDGTQAIRLYGDRTADRSDDRQPQTTFLYKWDGSRYVARQPQKRSTALKSPQWYALGDAYFNTNHLAQAASAFRAAIAANPPTTSKEPDYSGDTARREAHYSLGLCAALTGDFNEAVAQMKRVGPKEQDEDTLGIAAQTFLHACTDPASLPMALASVGQQFRWLEQAAQRSGPTATPRDVLKAASLVPDFYEESDVTGDGKPDGLAQVHWLDSSAAIVLKRNDTAPYYTLWVLAYTRKALPPTSYSLEATDLFYLPRAPALQLHPLPTEISLEGRATGDGAIPSIRIRYQQNGEQKGRVRWDGERFLAVEPLPKASESFPIELNAIEAELFEKRDYAGALQAFAALEARVRRSGLIEESKTDLLLEAFYHEALCQRKSGQAQRAAVTYAALWRGHPDSVWGTLAKRWLVFGSETAPGTK